MEKPNIYLERYAYPSQYLDYKPRVDTGIIVVLPCHNEPDLISSLNALNNCESPCKVEIIVVINASEDAPVAIKEQNIRTYNEALGWLEPKQPLDKVFHFILKNELPKKHAGVGLARKIGMDEAVRMFESVDNHDGVILCFDADCHCEPSLLSEVFEYFKNNSASPGCSINFEHPLIGSLDDQVYRGITYYELHLRYYVDALKYAQFPYAYHTIGSSMAVRSFAYQKQGGMNRRKAGEDFYFLHKIIPLGHFGEINSTTVYPSPRASDRVPFGTGRAVGEWLAGEQEEYLTYHYQIFEDLKIFMNQVDSYFQVDEKELKELTLDLPRSISDFIVSLNFEIKLKEIQGQSTNLQSFRKRFFQWFDGFRVLKYVHFGRDSFYPNISTSTAVDWLFGKFDINVSGGLVEKLVRLREVDKKVF
ncbi:MAG: glycosyltransferase involved in cell wall biosynthesis [Cyclobacteriaceae bacterium]|jgi:glycosyltransferase involved in cell wall biosynthesis